LTDFLWWFRIGWFSMLLWIDSMELISFFLSLRNSVLLSTWPLINGDVNTRGFQLRLPKSVKFHRSTCFFIDLYFKKEQNLGSPPRASPIHNTILISKLYYFGVVSSQKMLFSNHNTKLHTKNYFVILYVFIFLLFIIYLIVHFINKIIK